MNKWGNLEDDTESDEDDYFQNNNFKDEINVYDRIGMPELEGGLNIFGNIEGKLGDINKKLDRMSRSDEDSFKVYVNAISRKIMSGNNIFKINNNDIVKMLKKVNSIKNIQHKNPSVYVLGYLASNKGKEITKESINKVIKEVLHEIDGNIKGPDILRYARFWINL
tara:strand:+ start:161 stop:658 length:498 start_codon:yes stop_codon:yes gene_type:complete